MQRKIRPGSNEDTFPDTCEQGPGFPSGKTLTEIFTGSGLWKRLAVLVWTSCESGRVREPPRTEPTVKAVRSFCTSGSFILKFLSFPAGFLLRFMNSGLVFIQTGCYVVVK